MSKHYPQGTPVKWKWGNGYGHGTIKQSFDRDVQRTIDGEKITRHGSKENQAYEIQRKEGNNVLKLHSEIEKDG
ncbi:hypervirulence associated TUDOR domain-containing protein [Lacunimicrobium album]